ncbi:peptidoglycan DD-metalloendopeptidase family protein [Desertimonas flava]|uniref:peptidoglycan DD-metalloendopeptidase family protein n=1 Tax=Desertimonas flava TaxID=2064846 RepID=UPI0019691571|nr:peptidoglycan DD-metalloendopeptidase family protein [Desertimonas flava]
MSRRARVAAALVVMLALLLGGPGRIASASGCLLPPVDTPITRPFDAPACRWCAGHRGVNYAPGPGTPVRAAAAGTVTFSGVVVDIRYVVVRHADGILATYGGLESSHLVAGAVVAAGAVVGRSGPELYFGLRTGPDEYIDPAPLLGQLVVPPYLVPTDGTGRRPPPPARLEC